VDSKKAVLKLLGKPDNFHALIFPVRRVNIAALCQVPPPRIAVA
jgi:hypothetical protein